MSGIEIAPSILAADIGYLMDDIKKTEPSCRFLHIDVMDGHYVPNISFGFPVIESIRPHTDMIFDTHLMITNPRMYVKYFADAGSDHITFHIECDDDPVSLIEEIRSYGKKAGIAIHPDTPIEKLFPFTEKGAIDLLLVMSVYPGFGGQSYMPEASTRLRALRERLDANGSEAYLSVDGGIKNSTIAEAASAGARLIVSGSSVFGKEDPAAAARELKRIATEAIS